MNPLDEARALLQALTEEVDSLAGEDELTDEQETRFEELTIDDGEVSRGQARVSALEARESRVAEIRKASKDIATREAGADPLADSATRETRDPFDLSEVRAAAPGEYPVKEYTERARDAIEQAPEYVTDTQRQSATIHLDQDRQGNVAAHYLRYGSPEYVSDWFHYMQTGDRNGTGESRAALSTAAANGGYFIPFHLDPTVINTGNGTINPMRAISTVVTIAQNVWHGISSAGVTAEWTAEAAEWADASPTFAQPTITPHKANAYVTASFEVVQDAPNLAAEIAGMFSEAKDEQEAAAFVTGSGSDQPFGLVTRLAAITASRVAANTNAVFGLVDVFALINDLPARHQTGPSWLGHWAILNLVRQFGVGDVGHGAFWTDLGPGVPPQLLGASVFKSSEMTATLSAATASNDDILVLGNFSRYTIVDRIGMETVYNPIVLGGNRRPTGEVGWGAFWRVGGDTTDNNAFRLLRV